MYEHLKPTKRACKDDTELPANLLAPRMTEPIKAAGKEDTVEGNLTSVVWQAGCQKNKAELRPLCPFTASHLGTRPD
ncbi:hypothetical protein DSO57_1036526 [Entomophthora muscae]|uniref:Uncharacterized protein n=1 Tax=Entomophthora muscae TaxID=34485 RepID=A0ACC2TXV9_9FUNG|nr:hypothetical protein DSO57_1036526 [Entomophthora muscae]